MGIRNKVIVITGSSSGIGKAVAVKFARQGAKVVVNSKSSFTEGQELVKEIQSLGCEALYIQGDVSEPDQIQYLFKKTEQTLGAVDILINNAGQLIEGSFLDATKEHWISVFNSNLLSAVLCSQAVAKTMLHQGHGKIINTASIRGLAHGGREGVMAYSAAKAALISFTKTLAKELAPIVTVNAIAPGFVSTPPIENFPEEKKRKFVQSTAIKRLIDAEEIADAFLYLAKADAVTGEVLVADGGFSLKFA